MMDVLCVLLSIVILFGLGLFFHVILKISPEESWTTAIMSILLIVYITGLFGSTKITLEIVYLLGIIGIILGTCKLIKKDSYNLGTFCSPSIFMVICLAILGIFAFRGMLICNWDELYQWGKAANYMVEFDRLPSGNDFSGQSLLLSSTTFFHYFFAKISYILNNEIVESHYYVSNFLLWFSAIILPLSEKKWNDWKSVFAYGFFHFFLSALIFVQPYYNIYTDQPTAYWAGALITWILLNKCNKHNFFIIPIILMNVGLMKSMVGPLFSVIVLFAIIIIYLTDKYEKKEPIISSNWEKCIFSKRGLGISILTMSPIILILIWSLITGQNGLFRSNSGVINPGEENRLLLTVKSMIRWTLKAVNLHDESLYLSYGIFIFITIGIVYLVFPIIVEEKEQLRFKNLMSIYILGFLGYFLIMLYAYMTVFEYADSIRAQSVNRYYSDYMMLGIIPLTVPFFKKNTNLKIDFFKKIIFFMNMVIIIYSSSKYLLDNLMHIYAIDNENYIEREKFVDYANEITDITQNSGRIYFINQKRSGIYTLIADYELGDQLIRDGMCFNFKKNMDQSILAQYPIEDLSENLKKYNYQYIWVYSTDLYFNQNMEKIFGLQNIKNGNFYKIIYLNGEIELELIKRIR